MSTAVPDSSDVAAPLPQAAPLQARDHAAWIAAALVALGCSALIIGRLVGTTNSEAPGGWKLLGSAASMGLRFALLYIALLLVFHYARIHQRFGIFRIAEPASHFRLALLNVKTPFFWGAGLVLACAALQIDRGSIGIAASHPQLLFSLPEQYVFLHSPNLATDVLYAIAGFYLIDLTDWTAHWVNHRYPVLFRRFPFGHFVHHNMVFVNPFTVFSSPLVHLAQLTGLSMYVLLLSQGLLLPVLLIHLLKNFCNLTSHLGCDPLPWLSRLNHKVGGWLPWIPLHHQYHHVPGEIGNYGNVTALWDYVFGTLSPATAHHLKTGKALPEIVAVMSNQDGVLDRYFDGKTAFNLPAGRT
ncbi:sterol desaturase family protein [Hydrocarboniphaga sp.]|uniref:sterol desaturase family protein n=1 Tax=Hydrocarboniphaga sp. TaxID=2033016 RepID=UPI003D142EF0